MKGLRRGQPFLRCPRSLQFQQTGALLEGFERSRAFDGAHYQSVTLLILRTNAVLVWKVLPAAYCQRLLLNAGEHLLQLPLQFAAPINVRTVPGDVDVTVSAPSTHVQ